MVREAKWECILLFNANRIFENNTFPHISNKLLISFWAMYRFFKTIFFTTLFSRPQIITLADVIRMCNQDKNWCKFKLATHKTCSQDTHLFYLQQQNKNCSKSTHSQNSHWMYPPLYHLSKHVNVWIKELFTCFWHHSFQLIEMKQASIHTSLKCPLHY